MTDMWQDIFPSMDECKKEIMTLIWEDRYGPMFDSLGVPENVPERSPSLDEEIKTILKQFRSSAKRRLKCSDNLSDSYAKDVLVLIKTGVWRIEAEVISEVIAFKLFCEMYFGSIEKTNEEYYDSYHASRAGLLGKNCPPELIEKWEKKIRELLIENQKKET